MNIFDTYNAFTKLYDEALDFYTNKLGFETVTDISPMPGVRASQA